jgi:hypothetical protein
MRDDVNRVRLVLDERKIIGALVMGDQRWSRPLQQIIVEQVDVSPIRSSLLAGGPAALEQLAGFNEHWRRTNGRLPTTAAGAAS